MKKLLLALILALTTITINAQENQTTEQPTEQQITEAERIIDKYLVQIGDGLTVLSEKLEKPVEYLYTVLITQYIVEGIVGLILLLLSIIGLYGAILILLKGIDLDIREDTTKPYHTYNNSDSQKEAKKIVFLIIGILSVIITLIIFVLEITDIYTIVGKLVNPDYYILQDIKELIK